MAQPQTRVVVEDRRAEKVLLDALRGRARGRTELVKVTRGDAVALTGLPNEQAEPALKKLVATYRSHLAVTEEGEMVYEFDPTLERRDAVPLRERLERVGATVWRGFQVFFKVWIAVTLVVYVAAFIAMMIAMMFARSSNDRGGGRGGDDGFGLPWIWFWLMPDLAPQRGRYDAWGRPYAQRPRKPRKRFYLAVFDFVFGPKEAPHDPREADRRLIAYLRDHKGRVGAADLVALTGISFDAAEEEMTRLLVEYEGEVEVADDGTLIYVFKDVLMSAGEGQERWRYAWDRDEVLPPLTGNTGTANAVIGAFAGFNLLASMTVGPTFLMKYGLYDNSVAMFLVTLFPLIFSLIFFAVPAGRAVRRIGRKRRLASQRLRRALMREIWAHPGQPVDPAELAGRAAKSTGQKPEAARAALEKLLLELEGDVTNDEASGAVRYVFPRVQTEQAAVAQARLHAPEERLGQVVFSSEDKQPLH